MPHLASSAFTKQKLSIDFIALKHACPKNVYVVPVPDEPLLWRGVVFVRKGPYSNAVLRFRIVFSNDHPARPPSVLFENDVFHPLIAPLTTYTHSTRDRINDTISAADQTKLPPGGLTLRHGFPEWYSDGGDVEVARIGTDLTVETTETPKPHIIEVLQYIRIILDTEAVIDSIPIELAANPGAWHAWRSHRARAVGAQSKAAVSAGDRSMSPSKLQPGGARKPGEWNWTGVWEDRVRKAVQASVSDATLFGGSSDVEIEFTKIDSDLFQKLAPVVEAHKVET